MPCKIADGDAVADSFLWQPLGSSAGPRTIVQRPQPQAQVSTGSNAASDEAALKQRIAELEAKRHVELEQARQAGMEQGLRQGRQESAAEMESALDRLAQTIQDVAQVKRKVRAEAENELVRLSLSIAKRILHRELTTDPQSLRGIVYAALQHLQNREITRVRVFAGGVAAVRAALERNGGMTAIEVVADGQMQPGALIFETAVGELDASVETQLQEIERGFVDKLQLR